MIGARQPRWRFTLLDRNDQPLRRLDGVTGGDVKVEALTRLGGSGSLALDERGQGIDWMSHRVQAVYDPGISGVDGWPIATMLFTSPHLTRQDGLIGYSVELLPKLAVIDEDATETGYSLAAGANIVDAVVALIESTGETRISATPSDKVLANPQTWPAGESKLTIINDLLTSAGYWSLWCDGSGLFRVEPYLSPADRPVAYRFEAGQASIHKAGWEREQDLASVPNRYVVVGQGTDEEPPLVGVALNEDPDSPFSFQARGRWITRTETGVEGADQAVFDQLAQRRLTDAMSPTGKLSVIHAPVPLEPNGRVAFRTAPVSVDATVMSMSYSFAWDTQVDAEWREIPGTELPPSLPDPVQTGSRGLVAAETGYLALTHSEPFAVEEAGEEGYYAILDGAGVLTPAAESGYYVFGG